MDERRKQPVWPWTIRVIAISLPILYPIDTRPKGFNEVQSSVPGVAIVALFAFIVSCSYRSP